MELQDCELEHPGPGQVLLHTEWTLISTGTELTALSGDFPEGSRWAEYIRYPVTSVGYSSVARVAALGEGVSGVALGERVGSMAPHATAALHPAERLWPVPPEVPGEVAAFATLAEIVMQGVRRGRVAFGESVVVVGAGLLGQLAVLYSRAAGAWPVLLVDPASPRLEVARRLGATHLFPGCAEQAAEAVREATRGRMADVVIEVTGNPAAMPGSLRLARQLGRVVLLGSPRGPVTLDLHNEVHSLGLELIGAHNRTHPATSTPQTPWSIARHVELFYDWCAAGLLDVWPLITHRYPWQQAAEAYAMLLADRSRALGVVLDWSA